MLLTNLPHNFSTRKWIVHEVANGLPKFIHCWQAVLFVYLCQFGEKWTDTGQGSTCPEGKWTAFILHLYPKHFTIYASCSPIHTHTNTLTHQQRLAAMQGTSQLIRSNWGLGISLGTPWHTQNQTGNPPTARPLLYLLSHIAHIGDLVQWLRPCSGGAVWVEVAVRRRCCYLSLQVSFFKAACLPHIQAKNYSQICQQGTLFTT